MAGTETRKVRFVRALVKSGAARREGEVFRTGTAGSGASLSAPACRGLVRDGVAAFDGETLIPCAGSRTWLRRKLAAGEGGYAGQHRETVTDADGVTVNLSESLLARLAAERQGTPFLEPHQLAAGERFRKLSERARLRAHTTTSYSGEQTASGGRGGWREAGVSDMAFDARR